MERRADRPVRCLVEHPHRGRFGGGGEIPDDRDVRGGGGVGDAELREVDARDPVVVCGGVGRDGEGGELGDRSVAAVEVGSAPWSATLTIANLEGWVASA
jgi:hypothetical protein